MASMELIIAGFGGQGILFLGEMLTQAAILEGKHEIVVSGPILTDKPVSQQMAVDLGSVALGRLIAPKANESR